MNRSVLLVDDDPVFRGLARRLLSAAGLTEIAEADSVSTALGVAANVLPTAALVDMELPDGNGIDLARQLVALPWQPHVLLTSIDADAAGGDDVMRSGAIAFIHKADLPNAPLARLLGAD